MNTGHCPICWDGYEICKCTDSDRRAYEADLAKEMKKHMDAERKRYHNMLDKTFDKVSYSEQFPIAFLKVIVKSLTQAQWLDLRNQLNTYFHVN